MSCHGASHGLPTYTHQLLAWEVFRNVNLPITLHTLGPPRRAAPGQVAYRSLACQMYRRAMHTVLLAEWCPAGPGRAVPCRRAGRAVPRRAAPGRPGRGRSAHYLSIFPCLPFAVADAMLSFSPVVENRPMRPHASALPVPRHAYAEPRRPPPRARAGPRRGR